jgi:hypothetical protein
MFFAIQFVMNKFLGPTANSNSTSPAVPDFTEAAAPISTNPHDNPPRFIAPLWPAKTPLDISIYISPSVVIPSLQALPSEYHVFDEKNFIPDTGDVRETSTTFPVPKEVQNNGTLWGHYYVGISGAILDPSDPAYNPSQAYHFVRPLNQYYPKKKIAKTKKLLGGDADVSTETNTVLTAPSGKVISSYYHSNVSLSIVPDWGAQQYGHMHPSLGQYIVLESTGARDAKGEAAWYYPILFTNQFWQLRSQMTEVNDTIQTLPLHINLNTMPHWKFGIIASIDASMKSSAQGNSAGGLGGDGSELEEFKRILLETNIYLLSTTFFVSILHMIFEGLAFKNDISHWRKKKDNIGVSVRTILANCFMQLIIFLYLVDNSDGTSWMILAGQGFGIVLEAWKITKTVNVRVRPAPAGSFLPYTIVFEDKHKLSDVEKKTEEYDQIAFKYMYIVAVPLLLAYAGYSVVYDTHKSWYSFVVTTLVGSVYAYGFLMMVPSLYINYRLQVCFTTSLLQCHMLTSLQSVAHMPGRTMTYKFLNTFIDDLFAFTIKMPTLHRLATLRDDVIFFIYIYQRYKYKTDFTRINEFGQGGEEEELEEKTANNPLVAPAGADASVNVSGPEKAKQISGKLDSAAGTGAEKEAARKRK